MKKLRETGPGRYFAPESMFSIPHWITPNIDVAFPSVAATGDGGPLP